VDELKARVADLEKLQAQQQQLISLKDSELAAAQQRLAESNAGPAATAMADAAPADRADAAGNAGFAWIGLVLLAAGLVAWWALRRRRQPERASRVFDTVAMAAAVPEKKAAPPAAAAPGPGAGRDVPPWNAVVPPSPPTWHAPVAPESDAAAPAAQGPVPGFARETIDTAPEAGGQSAVDRLVPATVGAQAADAAPAGRERLELARAYIDLGDTDTARTLLAEVADSRHADVRDEAARLLRDLA
jgi:pilus assembly protein FimV